MKKQFLLTGENTYYEVESGTAHLYAVRLEGEDPRGRFYHFKTVEDGGGFADYAPVKSPGAVWGCVVKHMGDADGLRAVPGARSNDPGEFSRFIAALEEELEQDAALLQKRDAYSSQVLSQAAVRLAEVNARLSKWSWDEFDDENEYVEVCKVLCDYLKVEAKIPAKDIAGDFDNMAEEMLYLSGIRYKEVSLPENWWKHNNGALMGYLEDGTPVALMPERISGYRAYDPK